MPTLKQWAEGHGAAPVSRVVKRIERFATNTGDSDTAIAAQELVDMLKAVQPKEKSDDAAE